MATLSEAQSKRLLANHGIGMLDERTAPDAGAAVRAAADIGFPVVAKLCGEGIAHKTERGLVRLALADADAVHRAASELLAAATPDDGPVEVLVAPMLSGTRELIAGVVTDAQFGLCVMVGVGGVLAEAIADVAFRLVPVTRVDAHEMIDDLASQALLESVRGEPRVDRDALADILVGLSAAAESDDRILAIDVNPLIVVDGRPVAVDALVEIG